MSLSIIIPTLNEEKYIKDCLTSLLIGLKKVKDYEIIVVDGHSTDKTKKIVNLISQDNQNIKLIDNPNKTAPSALNIGIKNSKFDYILRCDAHAYYPKDYIIKNLNLIKNSDEKTMNVGGYVITKSKSPKPIPSTIASILSSPFGVGNSRFRTLFDSKTSEEKVIETDTVPFGCFKKKIFSEIGNFNEDEPGNEDLEMNQRIINAGYKIIISKNIYSIYHPRSNIKDFLKQTINNGIITTKNKNFSFRSLRHYVPLIFTFFIFFGLSNFFLIKDQFFKQTSFIILTFYIAFILIGSIQIFLNEKKIYYILLAPILFFMLHFIYGIGSVIGIFYINNTKKRYISFLEKTFPLINPFKRKELGFFHNSIKLFSLLFSYVFFRLRISANTLDLIGLFLLICSIFIISSHIFLGSFNFYFLLIAYIIIGIVLFFDFVDGQLARAEETKYKFGNEIDNYNPDLIRIFLCIFPSFLSQNIILIIFSSFAAINFLVLYDKTFKDIEIENLNFLKIYKFFFGIRFLYIFLYPISVSIKHFHLKNELFYYATISLIYFLVSIIYYFLCAQIKK
tara:strand:+ start:709 stop:2400 length:1692 start_codon:yes stop_codon:yes gene_type:complete